MTKKSQRHAAHYENQSGCMWGFISILDFRSRSTRKLLSDKKHWRHAEGSGNTTNKFEVLSNYDEDSQSTLGNNTAISSVGKPSVKKLMEEEMFGEQDTNKDIIIVEVKNEQVDNGSQMTKGHKRKKKKNKNKTGKKSDNVQTQDSNASGNLGSQHSCHQNSEDQPISNLNVDAIIKEFCSQIHQESLSCAEHELNGEVKVKSNSKHFGSEEKLCEAVKAFMNQNCCNEEKFEEKEKFQNPKELMDALEILSADKELFLKLLEDSNLEWLKSGQNLKDVGEEKDEKSKSNQEIGNPIKPEVILRKKHNFFRRMVKSPDRNSLSRSEDSQASNRIVILKPGPAAIQNPETTLTGSHPITKKKDLSARSASHFSFSELKRRLKHAIGKEHHEISSNVISDENSNEYQNTGSCGKGVVGENVGIHSPTKDHFFMERIVKPLSATRLRDKARKSTDSEISMTNGSEKRVSNIYVEAKKHLSDMLSNGDEDENTSNRLAQTSLGRILLLSEYNTPSDSPGRDQDLNFTAAQTRLPNSENSEGANEIKLQLEEETKIVGSAPLTGNIEAQACNSGGNSHDNSLALGSDPNISEGVVHEDGKEINILGIDDTSSEGDVEIAETTDDVVKEEAIYALDAPSEPVISHVTKQICETFDGKGRSEDLQEDVYEENQPQSSPLASPSRFAILQQVEDPKKVIDVQDHSSPISVLYSSFIEDETSPASTESQFVSVEVHIQPLRIQFEEHESSDTDEGIHLKSCRDEESVQEYVRAVLQASGLNWDDLYMRSLSSNQILDRTLLNEIEFFTNQLCHDKKLLFDCIDEVLMEVYGLHFSCSHWVSFIKPSISPAPNMKNAIRGVWEGICWHLLPQPLPRSLEQIVGKDLAKSGAWMDLRFDVESLSIEICEVLFEELMEDIVFCSVDEVPSGAYPAELEETGSSIINL